MVVLVRYIDETTHTLRPMLFQLTRLWRRADAILYSKSIQHTTFPFSYHLPGTARLTAGQFSTAEISSAELHC